MEPTTITSSETPTTPTTPTIEEQFLAMMAAEPSRYLAMVANTQKILAERQAAAIRERAERFANALAELNANIDNEALVDGPRIMLQFTPAIDTTPASYVAVAIPAKTTRTVTRAATTANCSTSKTVPVNGVEYRNYNEAYRLLGHVYEGSHPSFSAHRELDKLGYVTGPYTTRNRD